MKYERVDGVAAGVGHNGRQCRGCKGGRQAGSWQKRGQTGAGVAHCLLCCCCTLPDSGALVPIVHHRVIQNLHLYA